jgi:hypothetical protein
MVNMKLIFLLLITTLVRIANAEAQNQYDWYKEIRLTSSHIIEFTSLKTFNNSVIISGFYEPESSHYNVPRGTFISQYSQTGIVLWTDTLQAVYAARVMATDIDVEGNIYAAGIVYGYKDSLSLVLGDFHFYNRNYIDGFIVKYSKLGEVLWADVLYGSSCLGLSINENSVNITGDYYNGQFNCTSLSGRGGFIAQYDTIGNCKFVISTAYTSGEKIATDNSGNIYVQTGNNIHQKRWLEKYNISGDFLWNIQIPSYVSDVKCDKNGDVFILGHFYGGASFGNHSLSSYYSNSGQSYLAKLNTNGTWEWAIKPVSDSIQFGCFDIGESGIGIAGFLGDVENSKNDLGLFFGKFHKSTGEMVYRTRLADNLFLSVAAMDKDENLFVAGGIYNKAIEYRDGYYLAKFKTEKIISSSIKKNSFQGNLQIYPNPAPKEFIIDYSSPHSGKIKINVFNHIGQNVFSKEVFSYTGFHKEVINLTGAAPGVYIVTIQMGDAIERKKIVIE